MRAEALAVLGGGVDCGAGAGGCDWRWCWRGVGSTGGVSEVSLTQKIYLSPFTFRSLILEPMGGVRNGIFFPCIT